jgi:hypothetical protein
VCPCIPYSVIAGRGHRIWGSAVSITWTLGSRSSPIPLDDCRSKPFPSVTRSVRSPSVRAVHPFPPQRRFISLTSREFSGRFDGGQIELPFCIVKSREAKGDRHERSNGRALCRTFVQRALCRRVDKSNADDIDECVEYFEDVVLGSPMCYRIFLRKRCTFSSLCTDDASRNFISPSMFGRSRNSGTTASACPSTPFILGGTERSIVSEHDSLHRWSPKIEIVDYRQMRGESPPWIQRLLHLFSAIAAAPVVPADYRSPLHWPGWMPGEMSPACLSRKLRLCIRRR